MDNIKPFTLEWWMYQYNNARDRENNAVYLHRESNGKFGADLADRYWYLAKWIEQRIINKYGE